MRTPIARLVPLFRLNLLQRTCETHALHHRLMPSFSPAVCSPQPHIDTPMLHLPSRFLRRHVWYAALVSSYYSSSSVTFSSFPPSSPSESSWYSFSPQGKRHSAKVDKERSKRAPYLLLLFPLYSLLFKEKEKRRRRRRKRRRRRRKREKKEE